MGGVGEPLLFFQPVFNISFSFFFFCYLFLLVFPLGLGGGGGAGHGSIMDTGKGNAQDIYGYLPYFCQMVAQNFPNLFSIEEKLLTLLYCSLWQSRGPLEVHIGGMFIRVSVTLRISCDKV